MKLKNFCVTLFVTLVTQCVSESIMTDSLGLDNLVQGIDLKKSPEIGWTEPRE